MIPRRRLILISGSAAISRAEASPEDVAASIRTLTGGAPLIDGVVRLDLPVMVENGNTVAMTVSAVDPPSPIQSIHVFTEGNPLPRAVSFHFGQRTGMPRVSTRIRLATSQTVIAIARSQDGRYWRDSVELLVTLAACIE